jgi:hypothetical protein
MRITSANLKTEKMRPDISIGAFLEKLVRRIHDIHTSAGSYHNAASVDCRAGASNEKVDVCQDAVLDDVYYVGTFVYDNDGKGIDLSVFAHMVQSLLDDPRWMALCDELGQFHISPRLHVVG